MILVVAAAARSAFEIDAAAVVLLLQHFEEVETFLGAGQKD